jgi:uncharacterized protein GlcG (DUF336 family)
MNVVLRYFTLLAFATGAFIANAALPDKPILTLSAAKKIAAAAEAEATKRKATVVIAVVDDGGHLLVLNRLDDTQVASVDVGIGKARTAAIFRRPSKVFEDQIREGRVAALALPGATPLQGGVPIIHKDKVIGAIGVSGNTPQEDEDIARAGADAAASIIAMDAQAITYLDKEKVAAAFAKGMPLLEVPEYKIHASRRSAPGMVEVHEHETDVVYVLDGSATFITGGTLIDPHTVASGEIRAPDLKGGETRKLVKGDVVVVPPNTPHWFKEVTDPFLYFVVKPISQ